MSEPVAPLDKNPPQIIVDKQTKIMPYKCNAIGCTEAFEFKKHLQEHLDKHNDADFQEKTEHYCAPCNKYFANVQGLGGHNTAKHKDEIIETEDLDEIYESDIIKVLIPQSSRVKIFDPDMKGWVYGVKTILPKNYILYRITGVDKVAEVSDKNPTKKSFMEAILVHRNVYGGDEK